MLEVLVCNEPQTVAAFYAKHGLKVTGASKLVRAMLGQQCLGYCLFELSETAATVQVVAPAGDAMLADGLLRSALHVACQHGATAAYYSNPALVPLLEKINFLQNKAEKRLKLNNLYSGCCHCNSALKEKEQKQ